MPTQKRKCNTQGQADLGVGIKPHRLTAILQAIRLCTAEPQLPRRSAWAESYLDFVWLHHDQIVFERTLNVARALGRADSANDDLRRSPRLPTNPEICATLACVSHEGPPNAETFAEYLRAFAHCFPFETVAQVVRDPLNLNDLKMFRYHLNTSWLALDEDEIAWVEHFNCRLVEYHASQD